MTLPARTSIASITYAVPSGSASSGNTYNITYNFLNNDEFVNVWYRNANGEKVELTLDSDFKIDISSGTNNVYGVCVLLKDIPDITSVTLERSIAISQDIDFNNSTLYPSITEYAFDKLTAISQDQNFKSYTIHAPSDEVVTDPRKFELPPEEERLGKIVGFDGQGKVAMYDLPEDSGGYAPATRTELGAVIIGDNLTVENSGLIDVPVATTSDLGVVKVGTGISLNDGTISVDLTDIRNNAATAKTNSETALMNATIANASALEAKDLAEKTADLLDWYVDGSWTETTTPVASPVGGDYRGGKFILAHGSTNKYSYSTVLSPSSITWTEGTLPSTKNWTDVGSISVRIGEAWQSVQNVPAGNYTDITQVGNRLVAVGSWTAAYSTDNGSTWVQATTPPGGICEAVTTIGTRVVAIGSSYVTYSDDGGETWTDIDNPPSGTFYDLVAKGTRLVAVGSYCAAYSDNNGETWTSVTQSKGVLYAVMVEDEYGYFVAVGDNCGAYNSSGTYSWSSISTFPAGKFYALTKFAGMPIAVGENCAAYANSYSTWYATTTAPVGDFRALKTAGNIIIAVGTSSAVSYSTDVGMHWTPASNPPSGTFYGLEVVGSRAIAVGSYSQIVFSDDNSPLFAMVAKEGDIISSVGGTNWTPATLDYPGTWDFVTSKGDTFVAVGDGKFGYSTDYAQNWTVDTAPWIGVPSCLVASDQSFFVTFVGGAYKSSDGSSFSAITMPNGADKMCYGKGLLVALVGNNAYYSSDDGATWTTVTLPNTISASATWAGIKFGGNRFVGITKNSNKVVYSSDGATWHSSPVLPHLLGWQGLLYGKDRYLALHSSTNPAFKVSMDIVQVLEDLLP